MKELKSTYEPVKLEEEILRWWCDREIQKKGEKLRKGNELFRFLEGPPTANGFMHIGHIRGRAMKDVVLRFNAMLGRDVWNRAGWDCQGLPVEIEVEKKLKLKSKRDIENVGFDLFVKECNRLVDFYIEHWRRNSERLGLWLDYDNAYETRNDGYIEFVWWFIKNAYEKNMLKENLKVVPSCPRCETPLSSHEVSLGYATVKDPSIYVKFRLAGKENEYILIWTTTPWTLPGDEAVSVHPEATYAKVRVDGETWIMAEALVENVMRQVNVKDYTVSDTFPGSTLERTRYIHPLLQEVPIHEKHIGKFDHAIICGEHVTLEEGTGCVHTAPAHGPEDFEIGVKYQIQVFGPVDQAGHFTADAGKYGGLYVKDADDGILEDLKRKGLLVWSGLVEHEYPTCWRCDTPLVYRVDKQWFLKVSLMRDELIEQNRKIKWTPTWAGENRFGEWLANAEDWCISRARIWGTPLNIWRCGRCEKIVVIGSRDELKRKAKLQPSKFELHRPWIDEVVIGCESCGGDMVRIPYVVDVWLDSGLAHGASVEYLKTDEFFYKLYPYDFITEAVDQTRGWFYSLLVTGVLLFHDTPYRKVLCQGHVLDKFGQKMSKSKANVIWAEEALAKYGADVLRSYLIWKAAPEDALLFDPDELSQIKRTFGVVYNVFSFAITYMSLDNFQPEKHSLDKVWGSLTVEDKWLLSKSQSIIKNVTNALENFQLHQALRELLKFAVEDISRFYIRLIRRRTWIETGEMEKFAAYATLHSILTDTLKAISLFAPFLAEYLYQHFSKSSIESIHMNIWPRMQENLIDKVLEQDFEICREAIKAALTGRQRKRLKLRWPARKVVIVASDRKIEDALLRLKEVFSDQVNAKEVEILPADSKPSFVNIVAKPVPELGSKLKSLTPKVLETLDKMGADNLTRMVLSGKPVEILDGKITLTRDDFKIVEELPEYAVREDFDFGSIYLDASKTTEIAAEAFAREVVRRGQIMRKEMGLKIEEYIDASIGCELAESKRLLEKMEEYLRTEVRIRSLSLHGFDEVEEADEKSYQKEWQLDDEKIKIVFKRTV